MELIETMLLNGETMTFAILFVGLLVYVMKQNDRREENYRNTINTLSNALSGYEDLTQNIEEIKNKLL